MNRRHTVFAVFCAAVVGCHPPKGEDSSALVLRSYEVPPGAAAPFLRALKNVFWFRAGEQSGQPVARAELAPDGRLLVLGSPEIQSGVQEIIASIAHHPIPKTQMVEATYWLVTGRPTSGETPIPTDLGEVAPALRELSKQGGPQEFVLWERLRLLSAVNEDSEVTGRHSRVKQNPTPLVGGGLLMNTEIVANVGAHINGPNEIRTRVQLAPGKTVVLSQTGFHPGESIGSPSGNDPPVSLYYLMRATVPNGDPADQ